jgi:hypothetical protein
MLMRGSHFLATRKSKNMAAALATDNVVDSITGEAIRVVTVCGITCKAARVATVCGITGEDTRVAATTCVIAWSRIVRLIVSVRDS